MIDLLVVLLLMVVPVQFPVLSWCLLMGVLNLGMSIMGIDQNIQKVVKGMVLLAAVIFDVVSKRNLYRK